MRVEHLANRECWNAKFIGGSSDGVCRRNRVSRTTALSRAGVERTLVRVTETNRVLSPLVPDLRGVDIPLPVRAFRRFEKAVTDCIVVTTDRIDRKANLDLVQVCKAGFLESVATLTEV